MVADAIRSYREAVAGLADAVAAFDAANRALTVGAYSPSSSSYALTSRLGGPGCGSAKQSTVASVR